MIDETAFAEAKDILGDRFAQILGYYCEDAEMYLTALEQAIQAGDWTEAGNQAHTLKSSSQQYGVTDVAESARKIESLARSGESTAIAALATELRRQVTAVLPELQQRGAAAS